MGLKYLSTHQDDSETKKRLLKGTGYVGISIEKIISTISLYLNDVESYNAGWYKNAGITHFGQFGVLPGYLKKGI